MADQVKLLNKNEQGWNSARLFGIGTNNHSMSHIITMPVEKRGIVSSGDNGGILGNGGKYNKCVTNFIYFLIIVVIISALSGFFYLTTLIFSKKKS